MLDGYESGMSSAQAHYYFFAVRCISPEGYKQEAENKYRGG